MINNQKMVLNIEQLILSTIILDYGEFQKYKNELKVSTFYLPLYRAIYQGLLSLDSENKPIDEDFLVQELISEKFKANYPYFQFTQDDIEIGIIQIISINPVTNIHSYITEMQEFHREREKQDLILQLKSNRIDIAEFQIKLEKVKNLYKKESKTNETEDISIDFSKFPTFFSEMVQDIQKIYDYPASMVF
jgi:replicative DNA helicase